MSEPGIALITGAAVRIGRALALDLATHGWKVGLHCHGSTAQAEELAEKIRSEGRRGRGVAGRPHRRCSAGTPAARLRLGARCPDPARQQRGDVSSATRSPTLDPAQWDAQLAVNLRAPVFLAKAFAAELPAGATGNIINIIDQRVWKPTPRYFSYTASKLALWGATRTLAQALAPRIRVNAIGPGPVLEKRAPDGGGVSGAMRGHHPRARHHPAGDRRRHPLHP